MILRLVVLRDGDVLWPIRVWTHTREQAAVAARIHALAWQARAKTEGE